MAQLHVDITPAASATTTRKKLPFTHVEGDHNYIDLPMTPPSPPYHVQPEFRHLREHTLLAWANYYTGSAHAWINDFFDGEPLLKLLSSVSQIPLSSLSSDQENTASMVTWLLKSWLQQEANDSMESVVRGDPEQLIAFILTQHMWVRLHTLKDDTMNFIQSHIYPSPSRHSLVANDDIQRILLTWAQTVLADYIEASLLRPVDDCSDSWQDGMAFLFLLHYHKAERVQDLLQEYIGNNDKNRWQETLSVAFTRARDTFGAPILLSAQALASAVHVDPESIMAYLVEFILAVQGTPKTDSRRRTDDIRHWAGLVQSPTTTMKQITATFQITQMRLTKTTAVQRWDQEEEESRLLERIAQLRHRLATLAPTRSSTHYHRHRRDSSATPDTPAFDNDTSEHWYVHPLQASCEDVKTYEQHLAAFQVTLHAFLQDELEPFREQTTNPSTVNDAYDGLVKAVGVAQHQFDRFSIGFVFGQKCLDVRNVLDSVKTQMLKTTCTSSDKDIQDMEARISHTFSLIQAMAGDLSLFTAEEIQTYKDHYENLASKRDLVESWVKEVRVWFSEATRIREWIEIRMDRLSEIPIPDNPLMSQTSQTEVKTLEAAHTELVSEIEAFDQNDMARLRAHVNKALTGNGSMTTDKDLTPAETTTIEITLTTLTLREKLMGHLRRKTADLQVLTRRLAWQDELHKANAWLAGAEDQVEGFIYKTARWQISEDNIQGKNLREVLVAQEQLKENVIQQLLTLETMRTDFDQGQFIVTMDAFRDLEDTTGLDSLPEALESHQSACEKRFEDLYKRITFARQIVEQRLNMMGFLYQIHLSKNDIRSLKADILDAQNNAAADASDQDVSSRVQAMQDRVLQLLTTTADRIPYPDAPLDVDYVDNETSNNAIRDCVNRKRKEMVLLVEDLDNELNTLRQLLNMHRQGKQLLTHASQLREWADDRMASLRKARADAAAETISSDDLRRLERNCDSLQSELRDSKENEAIEVLTKISTYFDQVQDVSDTASMDTKELEESSQRLTDVFDLLRESLDEHFRDLAVLRKKLDEDSSHTGEIAALRVYLNATAVKLPALKQNYGFITGRSKEQDKERYETLTASLGEILRSFRTNSSILTSLSAEIQAIDPAQPEYQEDTRHELSSLEKDWSRLGADITALQSFTDNVGVWCDRQRRLSIIDKEILANLDDGNGISAESSPSEIEHAYAKIQGALNQLDNISMEIESTDNRQDPLETANYFCARDRLGCVLERAQTLKSRIDSWHSQTVVDEDSEAMALVAQRIRDLLAYAQEVSDEIDKRMTRVGQGAFASGSIQEIGGLYRQMQRDTAGADMVIQQLWHDFTQIKWDAQLADIELSPDDEERSETCLESLKQSIGIAKHQAAFVRKVEVHAEAANNLLKWIHQCSDAVAKLLVSGELVEADKGLGNIEDKLAEIKPVIQAFRDMATQVFVAKDGSLVDLTGIISDPERVKRAIKDREEQVFKEYDEILNHFEKSKAKIQDTSLQADVMRKIKEILTLIGNLQDRANGLRISRALPDEMAKSADGDDLKMIMTCPLSMLPADNELDEYKSGLNAIERCMDDRLQARLREMDIELQSTRGIFATERAEVAGAIRGLSDTLKIKGEAAAAAGKLGIFMNIAEEIEVMISAMSEAADRISPCTARLIGGVASRADIQAMQIDLDTRYRYYKPKINRLMGEAYGAGRFLAKDKRVAECLDSLKSKWQRLQAHVESKRADLTGLVGPGVSPFLSSLVQARLLGNRHSKRASTPNQYSPRPAESAPRPLPAKAKTQPARFPRPPALSSVNMGRRAPSTVPKQQQQQRFSTKPIRYFADPKSDLDVALGNIVNDSPYKVRIKRVPGEVGRYWFGDKKPKLAYCRILSNGMVMVRVGGGWEELSLFLRKQKLLEDANFVSRSVPSSSSTRILGATGAVTLRGGGHTNSNVKRRRLPPPSTPSPVSRSSPFGYGIKDGNKVLVPVDGEGNQVEVRMTKDKSQSTKFITPWHIR